MFDTLNIWCRKWRLTVNPDKTKVIHFRTSTVPQSAFTFKCGEKDIEYVSSYKYLGLWINEHLNMTKTVKELAKSASRALSALYSKVHTCRRNDVKCFSETLRVTSCTGSSTAVAFGEYQTSKKFKWYKIRHADIFLEVESALQMSL